MLSPLAPRKEEEKAKQASAQSIYITADGADSGSSAGITAAAVQEQAIKLSADAVCAKEGDKVNIPNQNEVFIILLLFFVVPLLHLNIFEYHYWGNTFLRIRPS